MAKKIAIRPKSKVKPPAKKAQADAWVEGKDPEPAQAGPGEAGAPDGQGSGNQRMKRFTIDVSEDLHRRIKVACAGRGAKMADEIRGILEREFGGEA